jgi:hypothetical protein
MSSIWLAHLYEAVGKYWRMKGEVKGELGLAELAGFVRLESQHAIHATLVIARYHTGTDSPPIPCHHRACLCHPSTLEPGSCTLLPFQSPSIPHFPCSATTLLRTCCSWRVPCQSFIVLVNARPQV